MCKCIGKNLNRSKSNKGYEYNEMHNSSELISFSSDGKTGRKLRCLSEKVGRAAEITNSDLTSAPTNARKRRGVASEDTKCGTKAKMTPN